MFLLGENNLDDDIFSSYQKNGIIHLFAISGMQVSFLGIVFKKMIEKIIKNKNPIKIENTKPWPPKLTPPQNLPSIIP